MKHNGPDHGLVANGGEDRSSEELHGSAQPNAREGEFSVLDLIERQVTKGAQAVPEFERVLCGICPRAFLREDLA